MTHFFAYLFIPFQALPFACKGEWLQAEGDEIGVANLSYWAKSKHLKYKLRDIISFRQKNKAASKWAQSISLLDAMQSESRFNEVKIVFLLFR